jgi:hypothetical protein
MKESFKYRWGGRERLKEPGFGERGWREGDGLYAWGLSVENSLRSEAVFVGNISLVSLISSVLFPR